MLHEDEIKQIAEMSKEMLKMIYSALDSDILRLVARKKKEYYDILLEEGLPEDVAKQIIINFNMDSKNIS